MAAVSAPGVQAPGRSQIEHWDTSHLERAARDWVQVAEGWEDNFSTAQRGAMAPGGTDWDGQAAEAAQQRALSGVRSRELGARSANHLVLDDTKGAIKAGRIAHGE